MNKIKRFENFNDALYVTCINAPEDNLKDVNEFVDEIK